MKYYSENHPRGVAQIEENKIYYGIESELEAIGSPYSVKTKAQQMLSSNKLFYYGEDGSLWEPGIEVKSMPATWEWIKENRQRFSSLFDLRDLGFVGSRRTGMHIHCYKEPIEQKSIINIFKFVYRNAEFSRLISGREEDSRYAKIYIDQCELGSILGSVFSKQKKTSKNLALCFHEYGTMEFRMFCGTSDPKKYWTRLEAVRHLVNICQFLDHEPTVDEYVELVTHNDTPYLYDFLSETNIPKGKIDDRYGFLDSIGDEIHIKRIQSLLEKNGYHQCKECAQKILDKLRSE